jgi:hypothetical protein
MYKTLGVKWLLEVFCPASAFVTADRDEARNPQRFIHVSVRANWRYTILQHDKFQFPQTDLISLKLSLLNINVLLEKGFELESSGEIGDVVVTQDLYSSFNLLIDTEAKYVASGSKKHIRKLPSKNEIADFKTLRKKVKHIFKQQNEYGTIIKALTDFNELNQISNISSFKIVAYFSIIESLITHNPKNENYVSISSQLGNKIGLLITLCSINGG